MVIDREVDILDIEGLLKKLSDLVNISGLSAEIVPSAKLVYRAAQERVILDLMNSPVQLSASTTNDLIKARTGKEESFWEYTVLLDKRLSYSQEAIRTIISLRKTELQNSI
ncbi:MAG: hypothetical protein JKY53_15130 [Flavobacteriales bacterium]|nr:hypothetical protein [Flavobacteriales bacterium]